MKAHDSQSAAVGWSPDTSEQTGRPAVADATVISASARLARHVAHVAWITVTQVSPPVVNPEPLPVIAVIPPHDTTYGAGSVVALYVALPQGALVTVSPAYCPTYTLTVSRYSWYAA